MNLPQNRKTLSAVSECPRCPGMEDVTFEGCTLCPGGEVAFISPNPPSFRSALRKLVQHPPAANLRYWKQVHLQRGLHHLCVSHQEPLFLWRSLAHSTLSSWSFEPGVGCCLTSCAFLEYKHTSLQSSREGLLEPKRRVRSPQPWLCFSYCPCLQLRLFYYQAFNHHM